MSKFQSIAVAGAFSMLLVTPVVGAADSCDRLPKSALKAHICNPQAECRRAIPDELRGAVRAQRERECGRLPTSGNCHGPDRYDPQADCRGGRRR